MAETYHILNYQELQPSLVATLILGLGDNSRTKMAMSGAKLTIEQMLMASILDNLNFIAWTKTKDARNGRYKQKSVLRMLTGEEKKANDDLISFDSPEKFEEYMKQFEK